MIAGISSSFNIMCSWCAEPSPCHASAAGFLSMDRIRTTTLLQPALRFRKCHPIFNSPSVSSSACFPLMVNIGSVWGRDRKLHKTPQVILAVWGWLGGRKARPLLLWSLMGLAPILDPSLASGVTSGGLLKLCGCLFPLLKHFLLCLSPGLL